MELPASNINLQVESKRESEELLGKRKDIDVDTALVEEPAKKTKPEDGKTESTSKIIASILVKKFAKANNPAPKLVSGVEICSFAVDDKKFILGGKDHLRQYKEPKLPVDLNEGFSTFVSKDQSTENQKDSFERVKTAIQSTTSYSPKDKGIQFISFRNNLNKILKTPFTKEAWEIEVDRTPTDGNI
jgi:hypothetical protein